MVQFSARRQARALRPRSIRMDWNQKVQKRRLRTCLTLTLTPVTSCLTIRSTASSLNLKSSMIATPPDERPGG